MMLENHVPTGATCKRLKEAGFPQNAYLSWYVSDPDHSYVLSPYEYREVTYYRDDVEWLCAAPILTEILEQLPEATKESLVSISIDKVENGYEAIDDRFQEQPIWFEHSNPAEATALLWLNLHEAA
jgi:hypothetical protein